MFYQFKLLSKVNDGERHQRQTNRQKNFSHRRISFFLQSSYNLNAEFQSTEVQYIEVVKEVSSIYSFQVEPIRFLPLTSYFLPLGPNPVRTSFRRSILTAHWVTQLIHSPNQSHVFQSHILTIDFNPKTFLKP